MSAPSVAIPFAIGEAVWWVGSGYAKETVECPECCGSAVVTVILGNGEKFSVACETCKHGHEGSTGSVSRDKENPFQPTQYVCNSVDVSDGKATYKNLTEQGDGSYWSADQSRLFRDRAACEAECARLNAEANDRRRANIEWNLTHNKKSLAWSAHYHRSCIKRLETDLAWHRGRLAECPKPRKPTS